jgi:hypothetical protein
VAQTLPKDQAFLGSLLPENAERYKVMEARMEAAQYMQNSPGNRLRSKNPNAMLVPANTEEPAQHIVNYPEQMSPALKRTGIVNALDVGLAMNGFSSYLPPISLSKS